MSPLARIRQVAACLLVVLALSSRAQAEGTHTASAPAPAPVQLAPNTPVVIARSSLLELSATAASDTLKLEIHRVADRTAIGSDGLTVTVDGKSAPVTRVTGGYELPLESLREAGPGHDLEIVVPHDGIRELLSGKVALEQAAQADSFWGDHKQIAWWLLNIVVVLVAATAISRRKG